MSGRGLAIVWRWSFFLKHSTNAEYTRDGVDHLLDGHLPPQHHLATIIGHPNPPVEEATARKRAIDDRFTRGAPNFWCAAAITHGEQKKSVVH
jgi:hypothetical protein